MREKEIFREPEDARKRAGRREHPDHSPVIVCLFRKKGQTLCKTQRRIIPDMPCRIRTRLFAAHPGRNMKRIIRKRRKENGWKKQQKGLPVCSYRPERPESEDTVKADRNGYPDLRKCGYDPSWDMIEVAHGGTGEEAVRKMYLEVKYRVFWFNRWCEENSKVGVIDCSEHREEPLMPGVSVNARIFVDGVLYGCASAGEAYIPGDYAHNARAIQTAGTRALGRALANAGFGTIASGGPAEENGPLESEGTAVPGEERTDRDKKGTPEMTPGDKEQAVKPETEETQEDPGQEVISRARAVPVTIGKYRGKTMGEVAALDFRTVQWYASDRFDQAGRHGDIKEAAKIIVENFAAAG